MSTVCAVAHLPPGRPPIRGDSSKAESGFGPIVQPSDHARMPPMTVGIYVGSVCLALLSIALFLVAVRRLLRREAEVVAHMLEPVRRAARVRSPRPCNDALLGPRPAELESFVEGPEALDTHRTLLRTLELVTERVAADGRSRSSAGATGRRRSRASASPTRRRPMLPGSASPTITARARSRCRSAVRRRRRREASRSSPGSFCRCSATRRRRR